MAYAIICIVSAEESNSDKDHYERATSKSFTTADEGRTYKKTIDKSREPIMVPEAVVDHAIMINNERIEKEHGHYSPFDDSIEYHESFAN